MMGAWLTRSTWKPRPGAGPGAPVSELGELVLELGGPRGLVDRGGERGRDLDEDRQEDADDAR